MQPGFLHIMMVNHACGFGSSIVFPGFLGEPFTRSHPLHIAIIDRENRPPITLAKNVRGDTGTPRQITQGFCRNSHPSGSGSINFFQPGLNTVHGVVCDVANKYRRIVLLSQTQNFIEPARISGEIAPHVHKNRHFAAPCHTENHSQLVLAHGIAHVVEQQSNAQSTGIKALFKLAANRDNLRRRR